MGTNLKKLIAVALLPLLTFASWEMDFDELWASVTSSPVTSSPIPTEGLQIWLKGDPATMTIDGDGVVTEWRDQSGNSRHYLPINNQVGYSASDGWGVWFDKDGAAEITTYSAGYATPNTHSIFVSYKGFTAYRPGNRIYGFTLGGNADAQCFSLAIGSWVLRTRYSSSVRLISGKTIDVFNRITWIYDSTAQTHSAWYDTESAGVGTGQPIASPHGELFLGGNGGKQNSFCGRIFSFIVYDRAVTDSERQQIEAYLLDVDGDYY